MHCHGDKHGYTHIINKTDTCFAAKGRRMAKKVLTQKFCARRFEEARREEEKNEIK